MSENFLRRLELLCLALGLILVGFVGGCANPGVEGSLPAPVPADIAWIHGSVDQRWAAVFVNRVDQVECGKRWEPEAPIAIAPGSHRLTIQFDSHDEEDHPSGFLDGIEVNLQAGVRYQVRQKAVRTPLLGQLATEVWVEVEDGARPVSETVVVWPLAR